jgi:hypothetical protein
VLAGQLHAPCAFCGVSSREGLFPPAENGASGWRPAGGDRVPLCPDHKVDLLRGNLPFPTWCLTCDTYRPADHEHASSRRRRS